MIFFIELVKAVIFLVFPILLYLVFQTITKKEDSELFLKLSLFSSSFLFAMFTNNIYLSLLINVPLIISYMRKYNFICLLIILISIIYFYMKFDLSILLISVEYILFFLASFFVNYKMKLFTIIYSYFYSFIIFYYQQEPLISISTLKIICMVFICYLLSFFIRKLFFLINNKCNYLEETYRNYLLNFIHEVKNPIAVCKGYIEIIKNKKDNKKDYVQIIEKEVNESLVIMEDYLMFGRFKVNLEYMDINLLLEEVFINFRDVTNKDKININFMYNEEEVIILGDYNKLKQVFVNIIKNSIEAKKDEIDLNININLVINKKNVIITVEDNGVGIESISNVGNKFYTTKVNGTGLGINFSKTIIMLHNGDIKYNSKINKGTKVTISIPLFEM
ncbi:MAG: hypothetical protein J6A52_07535 [Bacilli bacterium]|nr:hypothetical protein [Bacilli bacterium]